MRLRSQRQNRFATIARKENERCVCSPGPEPSVEQAMPSIARTSARSFLDCSLGSLQARTLDMRQARRQLADRPARERRSVKGIGSPGTVRVFHSTEDYRSRVPCRCHTRRFQIARGGYGSKWTWPGGKRPPRRFSSSNAEAKAGSPGHLSR